MEEVNLFISETEDVVCLHFWQIERPNGPTSVGRCKACGAVREFRNSVRVSSWESEGNGTRRQAPSAVARTANHAVK